MELWSMFIMNFWTVWTYSIHWNIAVKMLFSAGNMTAKAVLCIIQLEGITLRITFTGISLDSLKIGKLHGE